MQIGAFFKMHFVASGKQHLKLLKISVRGRKSCLMELQTRQHDNLYRVLLVFWAHQGRYGRTYISHGQDHECYCNCVRLCAPSRVKHEGRYLMPIHLFQLLIFFWELFCYNEIFKNT